MSMESYEVHLRHMHDGSRWSLRFDADNFAHAEEQAEPYLEDVYEIITIEKDYR